MRYVTIPALLVVLGLAACRDQESPTRAVEVQLSVAPTPYDCTLQNQVPQTECEALVALYNNTNGPGWTIRTGWLETSTPCTWRGVFCVVIGGNVSVRRLELGVNRLTGFLPPQLGNLSNLTLLLLFGNRLTGSIPSELGNLANLTNLSLDFNQLTGSIPPELGNLANLTFLSLPLNQLTGSIPPELGRLSNLGFLGLYNNQLTGSIPPELGNLSRLAGFLLDNNQLTGSIPPELGNLSNLRAMGIAHNQLTGAIPRELGNLTNLTDGLRLNGNQLTGAIPLELGNLSTLASLHLQQNQIDGLVPLPVAALGGASPLQRNCFFTPGNPGLFMPDVQTYRVHDADGDGMICGLHFTSGPAPLADDIRSVVQDFVAGGVVNRGQSTALSRKIDQALDLAGRGKTGPAVALLEDFIEQVNGWARAGSVLTAAQAAELIDRARLLIEMLGA